MKRDGVIECVKSSIIGNFHGEVWNDYQNIYKNKYGLRYLITPAQNEEFNRLFIGWAKLLKLKLDELLNS